MGRRFYGFNNRFRTTKNTEAVVFENGGFVGNLGLSKKLWKKYIEASYKYRTNTDKMTASDYTHLFGYLNPYYRSAYNVSKEYLLENINKVLEEKENYGRSNIEGNVLANKLIDKKKLDKIDIKYYDDNLEMLNDLYNGSIKGILISSNYALSYQGYENYVNIKTDTKVVYTYREKMKNQDIKLGSNKSLTEPFTILLLGVDSEVDGLDQNTVFNGFWQNIITIPKASKIS